MAHRSETGNNYDNAQGNAFLDTGRNGAHPPITEVVTTVGQSEVVSPVQPLSIISPLTQEKDKERYGHASTVRVHHPRERGQVLGVTNRERQGQAMGVVVDKLTSTVVQTTGQVTEKSQRLVDAITVHQFLGAPEAPMQRAQSPLAQLDGSGRLSLGHNTRGLTLRTAEVAVRDYRARQSVYGSTLPAIDADGLLSLLREEQESRKAEFELLMNPPQPWRPRIRSEEERDATRTASQEEIAARGFVVLKPISEELRTDVWETRYPTLTISQFMEDPTVKVYGSPDGIEHGLIVVAVDAPAKYVDVSKGSHVKIYGLDTPSFQSHGQSECEMVDVHVGKAYVTGEILSVSNGTIDNLTIFDGSENCVTSVHLDDTDIGKAHVSKAQLEASDSEFGGLSIFRGGQARINGDSRMTKVDSGGILEINGDPGVLLLDGKDITDTTSQYLQDQ